MSRINLIFPKQRGTITPFIYGALAEHIGGVIYDGIRCGKQSKTENIDGFRKFIIDKIKEAGVSMIRWPGGCFAEIYDWRDGIGKPENRPIKRSFWTPWDGKYESNEVGTDEFLHFCELCNAEPYIAANITASTPLAIRDWMDYCNALPNTTSMSKLREANGHKEPYNVKFWGVGNENWGGGGNMTPEVYAHEYRKYASLMSNMGKGKSGVGNDIFLIGCGANSFDYEWTRRFLEVFVTSDKKMNGLSFHYYTNDINSTDSVIQHSLEEWYGTLRKGLKMEELITRHYAAAVACGVPEQAKLCIDEWGIWHKEGTGPSKGANLFEQQSTMQDAVHAAMTLNIFNNHCEKILLANIAQLVNNIHSLFLSADNNCILTPTYHVFKMFKTHQNGKLVETVVECNDAAENVPELSVSASQKDGKLTVTIANLSAEKDSETDLNAVGASIGKNAVITVLSAEKYTAHNTFEEPNNVSAQSRTTTDFSGKITIPKASVVTVVCDLIK